VSFLFVQVQDIETEQFHSLQTLNGFLIECRVFVPLAFVDSGGLQQFLKVDKGFLNLFFSWWFQPLPFFLWSFTFWDCIIVSIVYGTIIIDRFIPGSIVVF